MKTFFFGGGSSEDSRYLCKKHIPSWLSSPGLPPAEQCFFTENEIIFSSQDSIKRFDGSRATTLSHLTTVDKFLSCDNKHLFFSSSNILFGASICQYTFNAGDFEHMKRVHNFAHENLLTYKLEGSTLYLAYQNKIQTIDLLSESTEERNFDDEIKQCEIAPPYFMLEFEDKFILTDIVTINGSMPLDNLTSIAFDFRMKTAALAQQLAIALYIEKSKTVQISLFRVPLIESTLIGHEAFCAHYEDAENPHILSHRLDFICSLGRKKIITCHIPSEEYHCYDLEEPIATEEPFVPLKEELYAIKLESSSVDLFQFYLLDMRENRTFLRSFRYPGFERAFMCGDRWLLTTKKESTVWNFDQCHDDKWKVIDALEKVVPSHHRVQDLIKELREGSYGEIHKCIPEPLA